MEKYTLIAILATIAGVVLLRAIGAFKHLGTFFAELVGIGTVKLETASTPPAAPTSKARPSRPGISTGNIEAGGELHARSMGAQAICIGDVKAQGDVILSAGAPADPKAE